jgi:RNA polymerase sigma-70 factor (ECF subfamily)
MDDADLVRQTLGGDRAAYAGLVERYGPRVHTLCRAHVRRAEVAEELAQETLLRGLRDLATLHDPGRFAPWLYGIARNVCRNWKKDPENRQPTIGDPTRSGSSMSSREQDRAGAGDPAQEDDLRDLRAAVEALPEDYARVLRLRLLGYTYNEIAAMLGIAWSTVNVWLTRARALLRQRLRPLP